jgi:hypothetical protein
LNDVYFDIQQSQSKLKNGIKNCNGRNCMSVELTSKVRKRRSKREQT